MWQSPATSTRASHSPPASPKASSTGQNGPISFRRRTLGEPSSTLNEALKNNPFKSITGSSTETTPRNASTDSDPVTALNSDLKVFASIYPDVKIEVLRELLLKFDGDSRLHISIEQLVKYKSEWARGRILNPPRDTDSSIPEEEMFRRKAYIAASKRTLSAEFRSLNRSAIDGVMAEVNNSYPKARPILKGIAAKSWRTTISLLFKRKKAPDEIPAFLIDKTSFESTLQTTGDRELDQELERLFFLGPRRQRRKVQEQVDRELAVDLNQKEAEDALALFECQVCYNDVPFESITTCTSNGHAICRDCVRRSLNEAVFGQGWAQGVDIGYGTLRCVASDSQETCTGHIPPSLLQITILGGQSGRETWLKFEQRLASDNIIKSGLPLVHCPFCHYAESQQIYTPLDIDSIQWRLRKQHVSLYLVLMVLLAEFVLPTILLLLALTSLIVPGYLSQLFNTALINLHRLAQTQRFHCRNPVCSRTSCLSCSKPWHDPHVCHEPLIISLRTAVEAARTAALKRTCPRCGTSFVKSSGCNKLTCVCGYAMCYLCRKNIGKVNNSGAVDDREGGEGYRHFCEHFRPSPGQKCTECSKCDLYMTEDEELVIKKAGDEAEREWREREGMVGVTGLGLEEAVGNLGKLGKDNILSIAWDNFMNGTWTVQEVCNWMTAKLIIIEN